ncbi:DNA adenine methylase [Rhodococcoides kyotonense]|uniref:site-specific DNA-methyltransferase (adenine-specific) n=1 Tax=Rhodococcoides kyotonense TaxID=398843 RepID=A0A239INV6_9NOCA|nr:DNA adenine methylase [Rhodococcus kyotonensis]SNS95239.1 DNA adenine methylase/adenine-specific DNA-methyltransferase [Rhodococcus kyotonensis]
MGSKYRLVPHLASVFGDLGGRTALDAFSGSGVVSYLLKSMDYEVTSNDFLNFPTVIATATTVNNSQRLTAGDVDRICGPAVDDRHFIQETFEGLYFNESDRRFLDSAWSHIDSMVGYKRSIAISALILSAARRQPRGVFTFTDASKYDDGRRDLTLSLQDHFREHAISYNRAVFSTGLRHQAITGDVFDLPTGYDVVYLDPPYAPPRDDADYMKRYHFLEGLSVYWLDQVIMQNTSTKKIEKKYTPFAYKRTVVDAMRRLFEKFADSAIVLSYSSNAVPDKDTIVGLLKEVKSDVTVIPIAHTYSFGTHPTAARRGASEYLFVAR